MAPSREMEMFADDEDARAFLRFHIWFTLVKDNLLECQIMVWSTVEGRYGRDARL